MFSSKTDLWSTPQEFFNKLNEEFNFDLDPCSTHENAKCKEHFTIVEDGLKQNWG
ncbi:DNA N-6-adenine-methyltransferase, partial [Clostridium perfringens]|uniref:DNA N-6-adenine-methyltransferase n=1 Tax=Clostridium perfringens TaxID=1502 RepID=UPI002ACC267C